MLNIPEDTKISIENSPTDYDHIFLIFFAPDEKSLSIENPHDLLKERIARNLQKGKPEPKIIYVNWFDFNKDNQIIPDRVKNYNELSTIRPFSKIIVFGHGGEYSYNLSSDAVYSTQAVDDYTSSTLQQRLRTRTRPLKEKTPVFFHAKQVATLLNLIPSAQKLTISLSVCHGEMFSEALAYFLLKDHDREFAITSVKRNFTRTALNIYPASKFACLDRSFIHLTHLSLAGGVWLIPIIVMAQNSPSAQDIMINTIFSSLTVIAQIFSGISIYINLNIIPQMPHINATNKIVMFHDKALHRSGDHRVYRYMPKTEYLKEQNKPEDQKKIKNFIFLDRYRKAENLLWINSLFIQSVIFMMSVDATHLRPLSTTLSYNLSSTSSSFPVWALLLLTSVVTNMSVLYNYCKARPTTRDNGIQQKEKKETTTSITQPLLTISSLNP